MRGRKPKPVGMKIAEGNPGKRPLNANEPKPTPGAPKCPKHLQGEARKEWRRIVPELDKMGLMTSVDLVAMACYCESWATYLTALAKIEQEGQVITNDKGNACTNPWVHVASNAKASIRQFLIEFGLTPSSRSRLSVTPPKAPVDELADFMNEDQPTMRIAE